MKNAREGSPLLLCTRSAGTWTVHAETRLAGPATRGATPPTLASLYGPTDDRRWWRPLSVVKVLARALPLADYGIDEAKLPKVGRAKVLRVIRSLPVSGDRLQVAGVDWQDEPPDVRIVCESSEDITIDDQGRIFRYNGEQILSPGHEPEKILRGLADIEAGRVRTMEEVRARRP